MENHGEANTPLLSTPSGTECGPGPCRRCCEGGGPAWFLVRASRGKERGSVTVTASPEYTTEWVPPRPAHKVEVEGKHPWTAVGLTFCGRDIHRGRPRRVAVREPHGDWHIVLLCVHNDRDVPHERQQRHRAAVRVCSAVEVEKRRLEKPEPTAPRDAHAGQRAGGLDDEDQKHQST